jgi:hypothetical protein
LAVFNGQSNISYEGEIVMLGQKVETPIQGVFRGLFTVKNFLKYGIPAIIIIVVAAIIYFNTQMRPQDLTSMFETDQVPVSGQVVRYDSQQNKTVLDLADEDMVAPLWQAMEKSQVRYYQHISSAVVPVGGYYYEVMLATPSDTDTHSYAYSVNTTGETVIRSMTYYLVEDEPLLNALDALFTQYEDQGTPAS